ncbi:MAG: hypothetical protein JKY53_00075 [Flavobacteriales bacterium]|nr:hypothetical protein [Flavobacteriales bacterium]
MGNCKDCKHWKKDESECSPRDPHVGKCNRAKQLSECIEWSEDDDCDFMVWKEGHEKDLAFACDAESYYAELSTKEAFGCVQFESK